MTAFPMAESRPVVPHEPSRIPCFVPGERRAVPGSGRVKVVEILATGGNGGAQESLFGLVSGLDRARYDVCVVSLSNGSSVRRLQRAGISTMVLDEPDDAIAVGALAAHL